MIKMGKDLCIEQRKKNYFWCDQTSLKGFLVKVCQGYQKLLRKRHKAWLEGRVWCNALTLWIYSPFFKLLCLFCILLRENYDVFPLIGISLYCGSLRPSDWLAAWLVREDYYIVRKYPMVIFPRLRSDNIVCLELHATGIVGLRQRWCGGWLRDRDLWSGGVWYTTGGGGREGRGISGELSNVCGSVLLYCPVVLKRSPLDEARPLWVLRRAGEPARQQPRTPGKPPLNTFIVTRPSSVWNMWQFRVPAARLALNSCGLEMWGYYHAFFNDMRLNDSTLMHKVSISGILV